MNAIIYAAGRGLRLGPKFADRAKILLEFDGKSLLERHAQRLAALNVRKVTVVSGYQNEAVAAALPKLRRAYNLELKTVVNPHFVEGSVISFQVSLPEMRPAEGPILLMDGDVLYPAAMLRRLLLSPHPTSLLIDRDYSTADDDPVLVPIRQGRPFDFRKKWCGHADSVGESVGFFKIAPEDIALMKAETEQRCVGGRRNESYDEVLRALVVAGRFGYEDITGLPWTEIDFPADVDHAIKEVLPAINQLE